MSIDDIVARLDIVLHMIDSARADLNSAAELIAESREILTGALSGTSSYEAQEVIEQLSGAGQEIRDRMAALTAADALVRGCQAHLSAGPATSVRAPNRTGDGDPAPGRTEPSHGGRPSRTSPELIEDLRRQLPPTVLPGTGRKTHGRWVDPEGNVHEEVSGEDDKFRETLRFFREELKARRIPVIVSHVEAKLAHHMREKRIRSVSLVVNNRPCRGEMGCEKLLPVILPPGYTLMVYGPDGFRQDFTGGGAAPG